MKSNLLLILVPFLICSAAFARAQRDAVVPSSNVPSAENDRETLLLPEGSVLAINVNTVLPAFQDSSTIASADGVACEVIYEVAPEQRSMNGMIRIVTTASVKTILIQNLDQQKYEYFFRGDATYNNVATGNIWQIGCWKTSHEGGRLLSLDHLINALAEGSNSLTISAPIPFR